MKDNSMYINDIIWVCIFTVVACICIYGAIAKGAWWHLGTAALCAVLAVAHWKDALKSKLEKQ